MKMFLMLVLFSTFGFAEVKESVTKASSTEVVVTNTMENKVSLKVLQQRAEGLKKQIVQMQEQSAKLDAIISKAKSLGVSDADPKPEKK